MSRWFYLLRMAATLLLGVFIGNRRLWPRKWRLNQAPARRLKFVQHFVAVAWGIDENSDSGA